MNQIISKYYNQEEIVLEDELKPNFMKKPKIDSVRLKVDLVEDKPLEQTFLFEGLNLNIDKKDTATYKLEAL